MKPEIKQKWLDALRSGEYSQGTRHLYSGRGFCCLGVLCDIYAKEKNERWWYYDGDTEEETPVEELKKPIHPGDYFNLHDENELLPPLVADWAGLDDFSPQVVVSTEDEDGPGTELQELVALNDFGTSFKYLADLIEKSL